MCRYIDNLRELPIPRAQLPRQSCYLIGVQIGHQIILHRRLHFPNRTWVSADSFLYLPIQGSQILLLTLPADFIAAGHFDVPALHKDLYLLRRKLCSPLSGKCDESRRLNSSVTSRVMFPSSSCRADTPFQYSAQ